MKAIILAAGYGKRMRPLTDVKHKTLIEVAGSTIIDRIISALIANSVTDIVVAVGYRETDLRHHLENRFAAKCNLQFVSNERFEITNNIHTLALVFEQCNIDDDVILIESDLLFDPAILERAVESSYPTVALVDRYRPGMDGTVVALDENRVVSVIPPHLQGPNFDFSDKYKTLNIYKLSKEFCQKDFKNILTFYSRCIDDNCYYELILGFLIYMGRETIFAETVEGMRWVEVDDPNDLRLAEFEFNTGRQQEILDHSWGGFWNYPITDFAFIRNMYFPPPNAVSELKNSLHELISNYGSCQRILNEKLAYLVQRPACSLVLLNGVAQAFPMLKAWLGGKRVIIPSPSFGEYARMFPDAEMYSDDGSIYAESFVAACDRPGVDAVVVVNPNNPTGSVIESSLVAQEIVQNPDKFFIIDESFIDFSDQPTIETVAPLDSHNFVVLKSLSKTLGIPGIRLGYIYTHNEVLRRHFMENIPVWNVNSVAEFFLEVILKNRPTFETSIRNTIRDRNEFAIKLAECPAIACVFPSGGNFLLVRLACSAVDATRLARILLAKYKIYIRPCSEKFRDGAGYFRLAVRMPAENIAMVEALATVWENHSPITRLG